MRFCYLRDRSLFCKTFLSRFSGQFDEAIVERQVVSNRILPLFVFLIAVKGKSLHDELVNPAQRQFALST